MWDRNEEHTRIRNPSLGHSFLASVEAEVEAGAEAGDDGAVESGSDVSEGEAKFGGG